MKTLFLSVLLSLSSLLASAIELPDPNYAQLIGGYSFGYYYWSVVCLQLFTDAEENRLDPEGFEVALWIDGKLHTFDPADGYKMKEPMTWIPFGFHDDDTDIMNMYSRISFMDSSIHLDFNDIQFEEAGIQFRYTKDGETTYSNIVYMDKWNHQRVEVNPFTAIEKIHNDNTVNVQKRIVGKKLLIQRNGQDYMVNGQKWNGR